MDASSPWAQTALALVVLTGIATAGLVLFKVAAPYSVVLAVARAIVQLAALSLILAGIIADPVWVGVGLAVMLAAAIGTAARRARTPPAEVPVLVAAMVAGPIVVGLVVFGLGALEFSPRYVLAIGGIVIGNTMTMAILLQRVYRTAVADHWDEVEGWLALGATPRQSTIDLARAAIRTALIPTIDQTRTTGIVVLPGAFVGAVFAGASPLEAGRFQVVVLAGILASGVITAIILLRGGGVVVRRPAG